MITVKQRLLRRGVVAGLTLLFISVSAPAWAQSKQPSVKKERKWTLEVFGGGAFGPGPSGNSAPRFPAGSAFTTDAEFPSRANPSWYFGDGSALFNEVRAAFASQFNLQIPQIEPLDGMLSAAALRREPARSFGVRVTRQLSSRFDLEFGFHRTQGKIGLGDTARAAIEDARAGFQAAFSGLLGTAPATNVQVTSSADIPEASSGQTAITGVLNIGLVKAGRLAAHASAGVARVNNADASVTVRLNGNYQFRFLDTYPISETDIVTIRLTDRDNVVMGVFGGGFTYDFADRQALRINVRLHAGKSGATTSVDARPTQSPGTPFIVLPTFTNPGLQFTNSVNGRSSLSGTTTGFTTFTGDGLETRVLLTAGYVLRF